MGGAFSKKVKVYVSGGVNDNMSEQRLAEQDRQIAELRRQIEDTDEAIAQKKSNIMEIIKRGEERRNLPSFNIDDPETYLPMNLKDPVSQYYARKVGRSSGRRKSNYDIQQGQLLAKETAANLIQKAKSAKL